MLQHLQDGANTLLPDTPHLQALYYVTRYSLSLEFVPFGGKDEQALVNNGCFTRLVEGFLPLLLLSGCFRRGSIAAVVVSFAVGPGGKASPEYL